jgi:hypothetical protein
MNLRVYLDRDQTRQTPKRKRNDNGKEYQRSETGIGRNRSRICRQARAGECESWAHSTRTLGGIIAVDARDSPLYRDRATV